MALFRRNKKSESAADIFRQARAQHPSTGRARTYRNEPVLRLTFAVTDWARIEDLLSNGPTEEPAGSGDNCPAAIVEVLGQLRSFVRDERTVGATYVRDSLLDMWSIAQRMDCSVARPAEELLTRLVGRDLVSAEEILEVCEGTERAIAACLSARAAPDSGRDRWSAAR